MRDATQEKALKDASRLPLYTNNGHQAQVVEQNTRNRPAPTTKLEPIIRARKTKKVQKKPRKIVTRTLAPADSHQRAPLRWSGPGTSIVARAAAPPAAAAPADAAGTVGSACWSSLAFGSISAGF